MRRHAIATRHNDVILASYVFLRNFHVQPLQLPTKRPGREKHGLITFHRRIVPTGGRTHAPDFLAEGSDLARGTNGCASQYTQVT